MNQNKGFTLAELLVILVILIILITMAVGAFFNSSERSKQRLLDIKIQGFEIAAEKWANDINLSETTTISVKLLLNEGYLESDNDNNEIINPVDNTSLNCYGIFIDIRNGNYYAKANTSNCDLVESENEDNNITITASTLDNGTLIPQNYKVLDWTSSDIKLKLQTTYENITKIEWYQNNAYLNTPTELDYEIPIEVDIFLNTNVKVVLTIQTTEGNITRSTSLRVRIDKEGPIITSSNTISGIPLKLSLKYIDNNGSGVDAYYLGTSNIPTETDWIELSEENNESIILDIELQNYYLILKDKLGNISSTKTINLAS